MGRRLCRLCFKIKPRLRGIVTAKGEIKSEVAIIFRIHFADEVRIVRLKIKLELIHWWPSFAGQRKRCSAEIRVHRLLDDGDNFPWLLQQCRW